MNFPLNLKFKIFAFTSQIYVYDSKNYLIQYIKQKLFKLKEEVIIYSDEKQTRPIYKINADRILDFSAEYYFTNIRGDKLGSIKRKGLKSIWSVQYHVFDAEKNEIYFIKEANPWIKVLDSLVGEIPIINLFLGYFLNPEYLIYSNNLKYKIKKSRSFFESNFELIKLDQNSSNEELVILSTMMLVLLERNRG